jgi:CMP-N,N'-diacetyllegionaminic acid synthase
MINGKTILAVIPARGGSKGLPGKNIRELCGKPLISWTIEKAKKSKYLDTILVTSDSQEIIDIAKHGGAEVPFIRPAELATDYASTYDVVQHALNFYQDHENKSFEYVVLLEPTSPLREDDDIDQIIKSLVKREDEFDGIVSVGEVSEHPSIMKRLNNDSVKPFCNELVMTSRRQDNEAAYFPYGVAYICKTSTFTDEKTFYPKRCMAFLIKRYQNYEIDDLYDFLCVECVMKNEWGLT